MSVDHDVTAHHEVRERDGAQRRLSPTGRARRIGGRPFPRPESPETPANSDTEPTRQTPETPETAEPPANGRAPERPTATPTTRRWRWIPAALLAVVALAIGTLLVLAGRGAYWNTGDSGAARATTQEQVLAAAKRCFAVINSYDYRKLDGLVAKDLPCATGTFRTDLREALQKTIITQAPAAKAVQTAQVNKAGIVSVSPDGRQWVILIDGQLTVSNASTGKNPRIDIAGAVLTLDRVGNRWLVSKVASDVGNGLGG